MKEEVDFKFQEKHILDSLNDGVYVTNPERKISYWNRAAERITGWPASEVVGRGCSDNILCHIDKDGHILCGQEFCPLHRSITTGVSSTVPITVFAQAKDGSRIPTQVSVAPIRDDSDNIIGGV
ncbi:MAG: PAS domain-containing protein, partial [Pseudomonadota bacterium]